MTRWQIETSSPEDDAALRAVRAHLSGGASVEIFAPGARTLVTGGARSGKSVLAESMLATDEVVDYVATSQPPSQDDPEWAERIRIHRARRPASWRTIETTDLAAVLKAADAAPVLIDCLGVWLARILDDAGAWQGEPGWQDRLARAVDLLVESLTATSRRVVLVTNEVGSGVVPATESGRLFRDELGRLNARVAAACDTVWLCTAGIPLQLKGRHPAGQQEGPA